jgi:hypothetical protein
MHLSATLHMRACLLSTSCKGLLPHTPLLLSLSTRQGIHALQAHTPLLQLRANGIRSSSSAHTTLTPLSTSDPLMLC